MPRTRFCGKERPIVIEVKKILFPTDFSEYSNHALKYAVALSERFKAKLVVLHVCEHPIAGTGIEAYHLAVPEYVVDLEQQERKALDALTAELRERHLDVEPVFIIGKAYQEIVKAAKQREVDVITMATHGSKGISHFVFGSTAEKVVRLAPCPVLTVKHPEHDFVK
jgi:nucleotide-binding universal stress UspA family protein